MHARLLIPTFTLAAATLLAGCGSSTTPPTPPAVATAWLVTELPAGAVGVAEIKKTAKEGDDVVVRAKIGGRRDPLSKGSALFVVMDSALPTCADRPGDGCKTPWDYCCETPESMAANNATVQVVDAAGQPLAVDIAAHGFAPMDEVVVVGTVGPRDAEAVLIIKATAVHKVGNS